MRVQLARALRDGGLAARFQQRDAVQRALSAAERQGLLAEMDALRVGERADKLAQALRDHVRLLDPAAVTVGDLVAQIVSAEACVNETGRWARKCNAWREKMAGQ